MKTISVRIWHNRSEMVGGIEVTSQQFNAQVIPVMVIDHLTRTCML